MGSLTSFKLLELPDKAVNRLINCLGVYQLMTLRLVCKTTKSWVEAPNNLKRLFVPVKTRKFLKQLTKSIVKWSSLVISCDCDDPTNVTWIRDEDYLRLLTNLGENLRILQFTEQRVRFNDGLDKIFRMCSGLEELEVGTVDLQRVQNYSEESFLKSLEGLRRLGISYVAWDSREDLKFFEVLFGATKNLEYCKVPFILSSSVYNLYPSLDVDDIELKLNEITDNMLFTPLKELLQQSPSKLKKLQVENFDLEQLLQNGLVQTCFKSGCRLYSVLECFEREITEEENVFLGGTLGSLQNCSKYLDLRRLRCLEEISILEDSTESSDTSKDFIGRNTMPVLSSVKITLTTSILQSERMAVVFLQQCRPSVTSVQVHFQPELRGSPQASIFRTPVFVKSFPNLVKLHLNGFDGKPADYWLFWRSFKSLEHLQVENCRTMNDLSVIGEHADNPEFLKMTRLHRLSIENCGDLTDVVISTVISNLSLELLTLAVPKATFERGLSSLASKSSPLHKSLYVFNCLQPHQDTTDDQFKHFLSVKTFPNLQKCEIIF